MQTMSLVVLLVSVACFTYIDLLVGGMSWVELVEFNVPLEYSVFAVAVLLRNKD